MSRPAEFTDDFIRQKIDEVAKKGGAVSPFAIRNALGGGNMNRIARIITDWESQAKTPKVVVPPALQTEIDQKIADFTSGVSDMIKEIYNRAGEIAEERVTKALASAQETIDKKDSELIEFSIALENANEEIAKQFKENDQLLEEIENIKQSANLWRERAAAAEAMAKAAIAERQRFEERERLLISKIVLKS